LVYYVSFSFGKSCDTNHATNHTPNVADHLKKTTWNKIRSIREKG
jgi:hypothetical protein